MRGAEERTVTDRPAAGRTPATRNRRPASGPGGQDRPGPSGQAPIGGAPLPSGRGPPHRLVSVTSSVGAVVALIVANPVPLVGVLFLGWNVWMILIVYWLENGIVGVFNVLKMLKAEGTRRTAARPCA